MGASPAVAVIAGRIQKGKIMRSENQPSGDVTEKVAESRAAGCRYEPPRVVKSRRLADITGQIAPVPSGTPAVQ